MNLSINERGVGIIADQKYKNIGYLSKFNVVVCLGKINYTNIFGAPTYSLKEGIALINNIFIVSGNNEEVVKFFSKHDTNSSRPVVYIGEPSKQVAELIGILQRLSCLVAVVSKDHEVFKRKEAYGIKVSKDKGEKKLVHFELLVGPIEPPKFLELDLEEAPKVKKPKNKKEE
jgi:hypothetical protein